MAAQGSPDVVISQVYGGGGNSGATLRNDYIELFNRGKSAVSVSGWSVQYTSATGTEWQVTPISGIVQPGAYYLVREAEGANTAAVDIPAPDASGTIAMSATAGKVALSRTGTALSGPRPADASVVDLVGYGQPNGFEGSAPARTLSNTTAALRRSNGCTDTDDNGNDFTPSEPQPRNSATAPAVNCDAISQVVPLTISQIQGTGATSAYAGQTVSTRGVVTGRKGDGFWLQSLPADVDQNAA
ncbi:MAG: lamin tail domain-containing protein, partial [Bryobacteraceae bacterium]|nr:lamin tail domain-containing protein [Bryobacteraceae bacterium]